MTTKYKVHTLAKEMGLTSKEVTTFLEEKQVDLPKKHMTVLDSDTLSMVIDHFTKEGEVPSLDGYLKYDPTKESAPVKEEKAESSKKAAPTKEATPVAKESATAPKKVESTPAAKKATAQTGTASAPKRPTGAVKPATKVEKMPEKKEKTIVNEEVKKTPADKFKEPPKEAPKNKQENTKKQEKSKAQVLRPTGGMADSSSTVSEGSNLKQGVRHVDTHAPQVELDKYNERYEKMAGQKNMPKDNFRRKQKINQKSAQRNRPQGTKPRETEAQKLQRIALEKARKQQLKISIPEEITVGELSARLKQTAAKVIKELMKVGIMASINEVIDFDTASLVAEELGAKVEKEVTVTIEERLFDEAEDTSEDLTPRSPVVVVMGHVDHGKTTLLDAIRKTRVSEGEAGGITQHIGAYMVDYNGKALTFLDTPGHEAFTSMRARGAQITDIAILVVAADDGIMPQTVEAIDHAKAADMPIIVAINKMDKPDANPDRIKQELTEHGLVVEEWGGDVICVPISAKKGEGIDDLLEMVLLTADVMELKANPNRLAKGVVIEAKLDKGRGPVATVLVQNGTLHAGEVVIAGTAVGHVRTMENDQGIALEEAGPSVPVEITGLAEVPSAGDLVNAVADERLARELSDRRRTEKKETKFSEYQKVTLDNLFSQIEQGEIKELPIIVKADVQGTAEAVKQSLEKLTNSEVRVRVIHAGVGAVNESDIMLATASNAIIIGFNVRPDPVAQASADQAEIDMHMYRVIYDALNDVKDAMRGMLDPKYRDVNIGRLQVREVYKISSVGTVSGCTVEDGHVERGAKIRVVRDGIVITEDEIKSLRRFKDDVKEVRAGFECGVTLANFGDVKVDDIFEAFITEAYQDDSMFE